MSNIEYEVQPNKLTTPVSYAARVRSRGVVTREQLAQSIAQRMGTDVASVLGVWSVQGRVLVEFLQAGMSVEVDDMATVSLSITARMDGPNDPLPGDAQLNIILRPDRKLSDAVRAGASVTRIEPSNLAAQIVAVTTPVGDIAALAPGMIVQSDGYRQGFNPERADEGAFLVPGDGSPAVRFTNYLASGDRKLLMAVPAGLATGTDWTLEVRTRTRGGSPTSPLYVGYWNTPLHSV